MLPCSCRCGKGSDNSRDLQLRRCGQPHGQSDRRSSGTAANAGHCPILIGDASEIILLRIFRKCQEADRRESGNNRKSDCRDSRNNAGQGGDSENAVRIQIYTVIVSYCLVAIVHLQMKLETSVYNALQVIGISLTDTTPLIDLFNKSNLSIDKELDGVYEPMLFDF